MLVDPSCTGHEQSFTMLFIKSVNGITQASVHFYKIRRNMTVRHFVFGYALFF